MTAYALTALARDVQLEACPHDHGISQQGFRQGARTDGLYGHWIRLVEFVRFGKGPFTRGRLPAPSKGGHDAPLHAILLFARAGHGTGMLSAATPLLRETARLLEPSECGGDSV